MLLLLQGTLREKEGCRNYQITRLCPEVIWGKLLDKETIGEAQKEMGFARVYRCGGLTESTLEVPHGVWDHAHDAHRPRVGSSGRGIITPPTPISFELEGPGEMPGNLAKIITPWDLNQVYVVLKFLHVCGPI